MCQNPGILPDGTRIACRKCWQCLERKIDDWVGRCIAESKTARASHSITLTYGRDDNGNEDHFRSAWLTYSDVQKMFKLLRKDGYKFRYIVCGEYGSGKGRAHWHLLIFWSNNPPPHELSSRASAKRFENKYWPHGFQHWENINAKSIRYVCKYINKDQGKMERQGHLSMSKKPPLGDRYFRQLAEQYVQQGLAPQSLEYKFPEVTTKDGGPKKFHMSSTTARNFLDHYIETWDRVMKDHQPVSDLVEEYQDKVSSLLVEEFFPSDKPRPVKCPDGYDGPFTGLDPDGKPSVVAKSITGDTRQYYVKYEDGYKWQKDHLNTDERRIRDEVEANYGGNRYAHARKRAINRRPPL